MPPKRGRKKEESEEEDSEPEIEEDEDDDDDDASPRAPVAPLARSPSNRPKRQAQEKVAVAQEEQVRLGTWG